MFEGFIAQFLKELQRQVGDREVVGCWELLHVVVEKRSLLWRSVLKHRAQWHCLSGS